MSFPWRSEVRDFLVRLFRRRTAVVGVGAPLRGDDAAGSVLAGRLRERFPVLVFDTAGAPENYFEAVAAASPEAVVVVDAARFGGAPGEVKIFRPGEIAAGGLSTHDQSLRLFADYLLARCGCELYVIGIRPVSSRLGEPLSRPVEAAVEVLDEILSDLLRGTSGP